MVRYVQSSAHKTTELEVDDVEGESRYVSISSSCIDSDDITPALVPMNEASTMQISQTSQDAAHCTGQLW